jgi:hypothetical protein
MRAAGRSSPTCPKVNRANPHSDRLRMVRPVQFRMRSCA